MPIHEFKCSAGHITERLFLTFAEAEEVQSIHCPACKMPPRYADRVEFSVPGQAICYGEGFYRPAASGNHGYKRNDPSEGVKDLIGNAGGAGKLVNQMGGK